MRSLFRNLSNRSNSISEGDPPRPSEPHTSSTPSAPILPPVAPLVAQGFPGITAVLASTSSNAPAALSSRPIPVPVRRRQSEPVPTERWVRPTLPSYAVSRLPASGGSGPHRAADIPSYEDALSDGPSSVPRGASLNVEDEAVLNWASREYFGSSSLGRTSALRDSDSAFDNEEGVGMGEGPLDGDGDADGDADDDPLIPRRPGMVVDRRYSTGGQPPLHVPERRHTSFSTSLGAVREDNIPPAFLDIPAPTSEPPIYSPALGQDELRLISTVHLADDHPAAAFFNAIVTSPTGNGSDRDGEGAGAESSGRAQNNVTTGGKKMKVTIKKGAERPNANGTGPVSIRVSRGGYVEGTVEIGQVDHAYGLEVAILGLVNVQYYIRGQYTVVDTLPLARRKLHLFPPTQDSPASSSPETAAAPNASASAPPPTEQESDTSSRTLGATPIPESGINGTENPAPTPSLPAVGASNTSKNKDTRLYIEPGSTFSFSLKMPSSHYREQRVDLPPTCDLQQIGLQANVEYMLKIKLSRKGWRWNDEMTIPIKYEPRAYINPARLRSLTWDDPLNPGWRSIKLHGGKPVTKQSFSILPPPTSIDSGPGVEVTILLPSPPILFLGTNGEFPTFPFHLHFHSELPHPLATFSDPAESKFIIRLTRVAMMRVGLERETRRLEIPTKVELWQDGGERMTLGLMGENTVTSNGSGTTVINGSNSRRGSAVVGSPDSSALAGSLPDNVGVTGGPLRRYSSSGSGTGVGVGANPGPTDRRRSFTSLGDRLRRRNSVTSQVSGNSGQAGQAFSPGSLPSSLPPIIREENGEHDHASAPEHTSDEDHQPAAGHFSPGQVGAQTVAGSPATTTATPRSPLAPLSLTSTDVHLHGSIKIESCTRSHADIMRRLVQSFNTPELTLTYIVEVTVVPKKGAVKEAFGHVWGGGIVEVVLGQGVRNRP